MYSSVQYSVFFSGFNENLDFPTDYFFFEKYLNDNGTRGGVLIKALR